MEGEVLESKETFDFDEESEESELESEESGNFNSNSNNLFVDDTFVSPASVPEGL